MIDIVDYERDVLRLLCGEEVYLFFHGDALNQALESLCRRSYVTRRTNREGVGYSITDKGRAALTTQETQG